MKNDTEQDIESSGQVEHRELSRLAPWSVIFVILSLLFFCLFYPIYIYHDHPVIDLFVMPITFILILLAVICGCVAIYRIRKNPLRYKGTLLALVGIAFASPLLFIFIHGSIIKPYFAINALRSKLEDVTLIKVRRLVWNPVEEKVEFVSFEEKDHATIAKVIQSIEIAPFGCRRFMCECKGDRIEFCRDGEAPVVLDFNTERLRWFGWKGDVTLTQKSTSFLADWLAANNVTGPKERIEERRTRQR